MNDTLERSEFDIHCRLSTTVTPEGLPRSAIRTGPILIFVFTSSSSTQIPTDQIPTDGQSSQKT